MACATDRWERARGLAVAGYLALAATDPDAATPLLQEALAAGRRRHDPFVVAFATQYLGLATLFQGDLAAADQLQPRQPRCTAPRTRGWRRSR